MTKEEALELVDNHKNSMINPVIMLQWTWLRVIINQVTDEEWERANNAAYHIISR